MSSDIQVFVRFQQQSVFAGETLRSTITFKNVTSAYDHALDTKAWQFRGWKNPGIVGSFHQPGDNGGLSLQNPRLAAINSHGTWKTSSSGHTKTASFIRPFTDSPAGRDTHNASQAVQFGPAHKQRRSVSILSLGSPNAGNEEPPRVVLPPGARLYTSHIRSVSVEGRRRKVLEAYDGQSSAPEGHQHQVPVGRSNARVYGSEERRGVDGQRSISSQSAHTLQAKSRQISPPNQHYRFPLPLEGELTDPQTNHSSSGASSPPNGPRPAVQEEVGLKPETNGGQATKLLAGTSVAGSNRSSGDFRSLSNHSQETMLSEQVSNVLERRKYPSPRLRQHYRFGSTSGPTKSNETLLMGYAQVNATFTLDGALVDQSPFEQIKRKGFLGGQGGGGVVGVKTPSNTGGLFGSISLNGLAASLGGLLGGQDLSSLKEMKGVTSSRAIPLLSTPQSLLFVDLTLVPGEERSFSFSYTLPRGLPASYKGKAIKITYNLNIAVQGAPGDKTVQTVRRVSIPFKVFSGVNEDGEIYGHDLMQPYVILQDKARTEPVATSSSFSDTFSEVNDKTDKEAAQGFLAYVDVLLNQRRRRRQSSNATLEPPRGLLKNDSQDKAKDDIDRAIFLSKQNSSQQRTNRFEIVRNGKRIATIVLDRPLHRLGESVMASVDLSSGETSCYSVRCALETAEKVNPALALRSAASILRLSRRVHRVQTENTLFAERVVFTPSIPVTATPTLLTSGVNLDWALRFEFVTKHMADSADEGEESMGRDLLESVTNDERGSILAAVEVLRCETFEVSIPITVYGDTTVAQTEAEETVGLPI